ncbi:DUF3549 family protein [Leucothrix arctica]|uniref:DUF3549 domain-containing protein n=1 Tax=Leucothrix arctica TaxID=1481894 RepID=A0A317CD35_9GAMM|nr:DUF3549 family protein [Leucothrix arctica]PWQ96297.1 hypothetical protein DKT75_09935 [Leucothrix arctica]
MEQLESISSFLEMSGFQYRVFDMGRKIQRISNQKFAAIESQEELYPYPFQQKAWLSILLWDEKKKQEPVIWFLSFPIDEMGSLKLESRDAFMRDLVENVGENMQANLQGGDHKDTMKESPFSFKPREDRLAVFHALATVELKQPPSQHYEHTREYLSGKLGFDQWQCLGLQGVADVIARLSQEGNAANLASAIPKLPDMPLDTFMQALEHVKFSGKLSAVVVARLEEEAAKESPQPPLLASLLRALSSSEAKQSRVVIIKKLLNSTLAGNIDLLAAISGRCWLDLQEESLLQNFLEAAALQEQNVFNILLVDLMTLPDMRTKVLMGLRNPERSVDLSKKIGGFMGGVIQ